MSLTSVVSPLVDLLFNMMITMFLFLMIYMAVVLPKKATHLQFLASVLPRAGYHSDYSANVGVSFGSGQFLFMLARPGETHPLSKLNGEVVAPEESSRLDIAGDATVAIDPKSGLISAGRVYPDRAAQPGQAGVLELPVVVVDRKESAHVVSDRLETWGDVKLFFHEEHEGPEEAAEGKQLETGYFAVRRSFSIQVEPGSLPYDVGGNPLTVMQPVVPVGLAGHSMNISVPIIGGIEPYELEVVDAEGVPSAAGWLRVEDPVKALIAGVPPRAGAWRVVVRVKDAQTPPGDWAAAERQRGNAGRPFGTVTVDLKTREPMTRAALELPEYGRVGVPVRGRVLVEGGSGELEFVRVQLPPGLSVTAEGDIVGVPERVGDFDLEVTVTDLNEAFKGDDSAKHASARRAAWRVVPPLESPVLGRGGSR